MVSFPPCKINLGLNVVNRRTDGYHEIVTCFYPVPWTDILEVVPARDFSFAASGLPIPGASADNLCVRAYELLKKDFRIKPVAIHLHKLVPIGAGLGGGSADGVYTLKSLNDLFELSLPLEKLRDYAAMLGSDCVFFTSGEPMLGTGRGEILTSIRVTLKGKYLVIVKPEVHISTAEAFSGLTPRAASTDLRSVLETHPVAEWGKLIRNDFEEDIFKRFPVIDALHKKMYAVGAEYASMSGSGSAVFGIFAEEVDLRKEFESDVVYWSSFLN